MSQRLLRCARNDEASHEYLDRLARNDEASHEYLDRLARNDEVPISSLRGAVGDEAILPLEVDSFLRFSLLSRKGEFSNCYWEE